MEKWKPIFVGQIPHATWKSKITYGEDEGLVIELFSNNKHIKITFGVVQAIRILDEAVVQNNLYSEAEINKYKKDHFSNVIYEVTEGEFWLQINKISNGYSELLNVKHYVIITENYNMDIITEWEPAITFM